MSDREPITGDKASLPSEYQCTVCGKVHEGPALSFGLPAPAMYYQIPKSERQGRVELSSDTCMIEGRYFFVVGNIELPIGGTDQRFVWSVWISVSGDSMRAMAKLWEEPGRESAPPYFGWLSSSLPGYPETLNLKTRLHTRPVGVRPIVELEPTEHPLAREQRHGITWNRVLEINAIAAHPGR